VLSEKMQEALNRQMNAELYSAYLYLAMSAHLGRGELGGLAHWMNVHAQEELLHAMKFYNYVNERGGRVILYPIAEPPSEWDSPLAVCENVYRHEQKVTGLINDLADLAVAERDEAARTFLEWFVNEQVEEEESATELVRNVKSASDDRDKLAIVDRELAQREHVFTKKQRQGS